MPLKKYKSLSYTLWAYLLISIAVVISAFIVMQKLSAVEEELPVNSVAQYRHLNTLENHISALRLEIKSLQFSDTTQTRAKTRFEVNKVKAVMKVSSSTFDDDMPSALPPIFNEINHITTDLQTLLNQKNTIGRSKLILMDNRITYVQNELRNFIYRTANRAFITLKEQSGQVHILGQELIATIILLSFSSLIIVAFVYLKKELLNKLEQAKTEAIDANEAKSRFLANMSHEIRTPLSSIIGMQNLIEKTELNSRQLDYIHKSQNAAKTLLATINDVLDFAKIESGKLEVENISFEIENIMNNLANLFAIRAAEKNLEMTFNVSPMLPSSIKGDPTRIEQVLLNLIGNAVKFTEKGEIFVDVQLNEEAEPLIEFSVKDTGIGLTPQQCERIFSGFSQADTTITRKYGGSGLGLSICKRLADTMGGDLTVTSQIGKGSTFKLSLPFAKGELRQKATHTAETVLKGKTAIVIDDNQSSRIVLHSYLSTFGIETGTFSNGQDALDYLLNEKAVNPDVILIDWRMPGMDGIATAQAIQQLYTQEMVKPHLTLISAYGETALIEESKAIGIESVLLKPITQSALLDSLLELFDQDYYARLKSSKNQNSSLLIEEDTDARILLVEDYDINRDIACELISGMGFTVEYAIDGLDALSYFEKGNSHKFKLVLMDLQMPKMDGIEATRELRKEFSEDELPIVAMTADALASSRDAALTAGMNDFITKPIDVSQLFEVMVKHTGAKVKKAEQDDSDSKNTSNIPELFRPLSESIDVEEALIRFNHNEKVYCQALTAFTRNDHISQLNLEKIKEGIMICHTLKGAAAMIGAKALSHSAEQLESLLKDNPSEITKEDLTDIHSQWQDVVTVLHSWISWQESRSQNTDKEKQVILTRDEWLARLSRLKTALTEFDPIAGELLDEIRAALEEKSPVLLKQLDEAIQAYDYSSAEIIIDKLCEETPEL